MKQTWIKRLLAMTLVCLLVLGCTPVQSYAAGWGTGSGAGFTSGLSGFLGWLFGGLLGGEEEPEEPVEEDWVLNPIETADTVDNPDALRAETYELVNANGVNPMAGDAPVGIYTLKYFPVTLYKYHIDDGYSGTSNYNDTLHEMELGAAIAAGSVDAMTEWKGLYFGGNDKGANVKGNDSYTINSEIPVEEYDSITVEYQRDRDYSQYISGGNCYILVGDEYHLVTAISCDYSNWSRRYSWTITYDGGEQEYENYNGYITLYQKTVTNQVTVNLPYANYNKWTGDFTTSSSDTKSGNRTYSGLVASRLDENKSIVFNYTQAGIFDDNASVKDIYTNVGLPFVYDAETEYYTFDANAHGAYFHTDSGQGTSSTPASNSNLYFSASPQNHNFNAQDKRTNGWFPFTDASWIDSTNIDNYFFGMNATIPFSMTKNGRVDPNDDISAEIKFEFSGDDDVWVFIDGVLVLDIGGMHNMLDGTINFATNTWEITKPANQEGGDFGDVNGTTLSGKLFTDEKGEGLLGMTRETFSATPQHELTVYYLERGAGSSNCEIKFNLPLLDFVEVTKAVSDKDSNGQPLDPSVQQTVNARDFYFYLYKDNQPVANTTYALLNENGQQIGVGVTSQTGLFRLKNGQTARFIGHISEEGNTYHVVEAFYNTSAWSQPAYSYTFAGLNAEHPIVNPDPAEDPARGESWTYWSSTRYTIQGGEESQDGVSFLCSNTLVDGKALGIEMPEDTIVLDYGLPVVINPLANDTITGSGVITNLSVEGAQFGTVEVSTDGRYMITYTPTKLLDAVETLTYTVTIKDSSVDQDATTITKSSKIYIIPATSVYYEENFKDLIHVTTGSGVEQGSSATFTQEAGVVGTQNDSPYGSDLGYKNEDGDSYGTSLKFDTSASPAQFYYEFTGTGTKIFARTSSNSAYIRVVVQYKDGDQYSTVSTSYIDTSYKTEDTDLVMYNIPVYAFDTEEYGTYKVIVSIADASIATGYGSEFYLDGIRVVRPIDPNGAGDDYDRVIDAYASDAERHLNYITVRDVLLSNTTYDDNGELVWTEGDGFVLFTDTNGEIKTAAEYQSNGPKNEVYLNHGQSISFSMTGWNQELNRVYLGIKAPQAGTATIVFGNGKTLTITNTVDSYYDISQYLDLVEDGSGTHTATLSLSCSQGLISITNLKVTGTVGFTLPGQDDIEVPGDGEIVAP